RGNIMKVLENIKNPNNLENLKNKLIEVKDSIIKKKTAEEIEEEARIQENKELLRMVNKAKDDWKNAENYFHYVSNPDLVDLAIHRLEASKILYMYLLKEAKRKGVSA